VKAPETRYAKHAGGYVAYQVVGHGPIDVVLLTQWFSHVEALWDVAPLARFVERLSSFARVIIFDKRGTGLSDPVPITALPSIEVWMDDLRVVLDEVATERVSIVANMASSFMACVFAATHPSRVRSLVLINAYARFTQAEDYPWGLSADQAEQTVLRSVKGWGTGMLVRQFGPSMAGDSEVVAQVGRYERNAVSPGSALAMITMINQTDLRPVLPSVHAPALALSRADPAVPAGHRRYVADHIEGARYVALDGTDELMWGGDQEPVLAEIQQFLTGTRPTPPTNRVLATVLFTDIVGSTQRAAAMGDRSWGELLEQHHDAVRHALADHRGREIDTAGDGFLAIFDGPGRAVLCAKSAVDRVRDLGLEIRAGVHTGEIELVGDDVRGIAVHIGARVAALAAASEVLVTSTVRDLVSGSGLVFEDRGSHTLKGVPDTWRVFALHD
jgi:class 3 adenylate cyclase